MDTIISFFENFLILRNSLLQCFIKTFQLNYIQNMKNNIIIEQTLI